MRGENEAALRCIIHLSVMDRMMSYIILISVVVNHKLHILCSLNFYT